MGNAQCLLSASLKMFVAFKTKYSGFGIPENEFSGQAHAKNK